MMRRAKIISLGFLLASLSGYIVVMRRMMLPDIDGHSPGPVTTTYLQCAGTLLLLVAIISTAMVYYTWVVKSALTELPKDIFLSVFVFIMTVMAVECFFLHYAKSNALGERWSYKLWDKKYITHRTSFYYKDDKGNDNRADFREPVAGLKGNKKKVWFIGDSFTFGFGIEQTAQTFPALTQHLLGGKIESINLGDGGADTYHEKDNLFAYQQAVGQLPYAVVWQYFGNDIDSADEGPDLYDKEFSRSGWDNFGRTFFKAKSFLLDYIYWEYFMSNERGAKNVYIDFLEHAYTADSMVSNGVTLKDSLGYISPYKKHLFPLKEAAKYYKSRGVKFLVIIFPYLWKDGPENAARLYANRLEKELCESNTDVINLTPLLKNIPVEKREVNSHDLHPSPIVSQIVADTITGYMRTKYGL